MDKITKEQRSHVMRAIKSKDTKPERIVRSLAHSLGYRFRLHRRDLPGCPDLVFVRRNKVIFVHGCFWHGHARCAAGHVPKSNSEYWSAKIQRNIARDERSVRRLRAAGWGVMTIWECQTRGIEGMVNRLRRFLQ